MKRIEKGIVKRRSIKSSCSEAHIWLKIVCYYIFNYSVVLQSINEFPLHGNNDDFVLFEIILLVTVY